MKLIVGLGNPGEKYKFTKHNIGANVALRFAKLNDISLRKRRYLSRFGEGKAAGERLIIILPLTYMNLSGRAVDSVVRDRNIALFDILVICDDADLKIGTIRIRPNGSDGGHRGLRSIIESLGTDSFPRLRIGIGKEGDLKNHVLSPFEKDELNHLRKVQEKTINAILSWLAKGIDETMNIYNARS